MAARSLRDRLARRWMAFAACVALLFATAGLLLLFLLEDAFIDRQLEAAARSLASGTKTLAPLPPAFAVHPVDRLPLDIHARMPFARVGEPFEMRRANRRYVHVLLVDTPAAGRVAIVYDVTDQLTVSPRLGTGLLIVLGLTAATLVAARGLSRAFAGNVARQATALLDELRRDADPPRLRRLADAQEILEFRDLLQVHADLREAQLAAIDNERRTLAYLGHELRTPLQSSRTSLALLAERPDDAAAFARLERALARLTRAGSAVLWLATDRVPDLSEATPLQPVLQRLADELAPLAAQRGQRFDLDVPATLVAAGPAEVVEAILANLIHNALQHGGPGTVTVRATAAALVIANPRRDVPDDGGFGLGLEIVHRLAGRIGWTLDMRVGDDMTSTTLHLPPPAPGAR